MAKGKLVGDYDPCKNCEGGLRCWNHDSPCCGYYCGEYPGTGKKYYVHNEKKENKKAKKK